MCVLYKMEVFCILRDIKFYKVGGWVNNLQIKLL
jgi:hypothetical protein